MQNGNVGATTPMMGFSLIELLVSLAILATILSLAAPRYFSSVDKAKEAVLRENLYVMRDAIEKHFSDNGKYPAALSELVTKKYLRSIPLDPFTESANSWITIPPENAALGTIMDVRSSAPNQGRDGTWFKDW
jgi:general secretion pathway protein G